MTEHPTTEHPTTELPPVTPDEPVAPAVRRARPDPLTLTVALTTLAASVLTLGGWTVSLPDPRWALAAIAIVAGLLLLASARPAGRFSRERSR